MPHLFLTPTAHALAHLLLDLSAASRTLELSLADHDLADSLDVRPDTIYRTLRQLRAVGAVQYTRPGLWRDTRERLIYLDIASWVWTAVAAEAGAR